MAEGQQAEEQELGAKHGEPADAPVLPLGKDEREAAGDQRGDEQERAPTEEDAQGWRVKTQTEAEQEQGYQGQPDDRPTSRFLRA